jgi:uncharacterized protein YhjY with autotransporter beta-barrel domain
MHRHMIACGLNLPRGALSVQGKCIFVALGLIAFILLSNRAFAANPYAVGGAVTNPETGATETVTDLLGDDMVLTDQNNAIRVLDLAIAQQFDDPDNPGTTLVVDSVHTNATTGLEDYVTVHDVADTAVPPTTTRDIAFVKPVDQTAPPSDPGNPGGSVPLPIPSGNTNVVADARVGSQGAAGHDGYGVRICIIDCFTIGRDAAPGSPGGAGPAISDTITGAPIESVSDNLPGVSVSSRGGNGGHGGNAYVSLGVPAAQGGAAGAGGNVTVTSNVDITTSGAFSYGLFAQSRAGNGGSGGNGYVASAAGGGGPPGQGGNVRATSTGTITTYGEGAIGLYAQSLGGGGGSGGDSYGIVGAAGAASQGGNGGNATAKNDGVITTFGKGAHGILAESIGGDGGDAGAAVGIVGLGGSGDTGGSAGVASATNNGHVTTYGEGSIGIFAQAVGGGGGNGGWSGGLVSIGGSGAGGGDGGETSATNTGSVETHGASADALLAQSVGGGGGTGGTSGGAFFTLGGSGGGGGAGEAVTATNQGSLTTAGDDAFGLLAQSIGGGGGRAGGGGRGGGGGDGGGNAGGAGSLSAFGGVSIGGSGGNGGYGSTVTVNSSDGASIHTQGDRATGLLAQSLGGGGGAGGFAAQVTAGYLAGVSVAVGGSGGDGGAGGTVNVNGNSTITTEGNDADGLSAQSLGGGGGKGGFAVSFAGAAAGAAGISVAVGVGGKGGGGGNGGEVNVNAGGDITTQGNMSEGLFAQSLGGGGGKGGFSVTIGAAAAGGVAGSVAVGVGGSGGGGGDAGTVDATYLGNVSTQGGDARAVDIQAVGGGGGNGAFNVSGTVQGAGTGSAGVTVGVGGSGGLGGDGGVVSANIVGDLTTHGKNSNALYVQSAGGGGGSGAFNVSGSITATNGPGGAVAVGVGGSGGGGGEGKDVGVTLTGDATTHGAASDAVFVQSVGGAGGNGAFNVSGAISLTTGGSAGVAVGVGGSGGGGGDAGAVEAHVNGDINTYAEQSGGLLAQSLGGSGGNGAFNISGAISATAEGSGSAAVGFGGSGGDGGDGSSVGVTMNGNVTTRKASSGGVFAQSLGGAGGNGAFNVSGGISVSAGGGGAISVGVGGSGGGGGAGKAVTVEVNGDVTTSGDSSAGIAAQSLGGGGGNGAFNVTGGVAASGSGAGTIGVGFGGAGGDGGNADQVITHVTGNTSTQGADSNAILVQSNGGGGGNGAFNVTGDLTVAQAGGGGIGVGVGGFGGGGGDGGVVDATVTGDAITQGDRSNGVLLQSKGGGGGNGAINVTGGLSLTGLSTSGAGATIGIGVGGFGGDGGNGSTVTGHVTGTVTTHGDDSLGVLAQSLGGGGGNGALNVSGAVQLSTNSSAGAAIGVGGFGGKGGNAGTVTLVRSGATTTDGANSDGVVAQSVGGAGGNGGINISGALSLAISNPSPTTNLAGTFGLGGFGGDGGNAQNVNATVTGDVNATGYGGNIIVVDDADAHIGHIVRADGSNGVLAQSVGGDGGNGALNVSAGIAFAAPSSGNQSGALNIGVGGWAGGGGDAGTVDLQVDAGIVKSYGDDRVGVGAQSLGGGGGNGGINVTGGIVLDGQLNAGVGGFGGDGGLAQRVTATANTDISASGGGAIGFLAQSIGGGGGKGRINVTGGIEGATDASTPSVSFGLGGFGGAGNASGDVAATQKGSINVDGIDSIGVLAQSVGGGGGIGGLDVSGNLGLGKGYTGAIGIGGKGGAGANAGTVTLTSDGQIVVDGTEPADPNAPPPTPEQREQIDFRERANGILAQSIGGGGGNGGINVTGVVAPIGSPLGMGVGGSGGAGGDANVVNVYRGQNAPALLQTIGNNANGLTAQSIGGGGGNAGADVLLEGSGVTSDTEAQQVQLVVGGAGGAAGEGQTVTVVQVGDIATGGDHSDAILAQSIGGGGGNAALSLGAGLNNKTTGINVAVGGGPGDGGRGENVTVHHTGTITTQGFDSSAIFAQSIGGGGGNAAFTLATSIRSQGSFDLGLGRKGGTGGMSRDVEVTSSGDLSTHGDRAIGILAQSIGNGGGKSGAFSIGAKGPSGAEDSGQSTKGTLSVGLEGGEGGSAGAVHVTIDGSITTDGSDAYAIHAQSIGGGGGIGGGATNLVFLDTNTVGVGVGGKGGTGGVSGTVDIENSATLTTQGDGAHAIYAQSLGGAGGVGGYAGVIKLVAGASAADGSFAGTVSVGGKGGTGATSNTVDVTNSGSILTNGENAFGIDAESVGGGGGDGGMVINGGITSGTKPASLSLGVGGSGNTGGTSAKVTVINEGTVHTTGVGSVGIKARSVGGGGGNGGLVANLNLTTSGTESSGFSAGVNIGGLGGDGNAAGAVEVTNRHDETAGGGLIKTEKDSADGIYAESVGGGGGDGSSVVSAMLARGGESTIAVGVNVGGDGGTGGTGGAVTVTNEAKIETHGVGSNGIVARSVGGGGGSGGMVLATNAIFSSAAHGYTPLVVAGGSGGGGDGGGAVIVNNSGSIVTYGDHSDGMVANSIGGGGGDAGVGLALTSGVATTVIADVGSAIFGGRGGEGGEGSTVTVNHSGDITVFGSNSHAVTAESINGGGGGIALNFNGITSLPGGAALPGSPQGTKTKPIFVFHGGGSGMRTSNAGRVTLNYSGTFGAAGNDGAGNSAQAVGGGGGDFDASLGIIDATTAPEDRIELQGTLGGSDGVNNNGGEITSVHVGNVMTTGLNTPGLVMQSIGGGGGRANLNVTSETGSLGASAFGIGGTNGTDERGGNIAHSQSGSISTSGDASHGVLLQSIGGGGGLLSYRLGGSAVPPVPAAGKAQARQFGAAALTGAHSAPVGLNFGSAGGSGLDGQKIQFNMSGDVSTGGDNAAGMIFQSIGGGGGAANVIGASALDVAVGGSAGANGSGGDINVTHTGNVSTTGARAHGVIVQSIGGGGSAVFTDVATPTVTHSSDNNGNGGTITFSQIGNIVTTGAEARGLLVQSLGGGGGFVDGAFAGTAGGRGAGDAISLTLNGDLMTLGARATALTAQSLGSLGGGDIHVTLSAGRSLVGGADGVAVAFDGGANNVFENRGSIMTLSGATGIAFTGGAGNDVLVNDGVVVGNIAMGGGANRFANNKGAVLDSGTMVDLGSSNNQLVNNGMMAPGGKGTVMTSALTGNLTQGASGSYAADLDVSSSSGNSDRVSGTGSANLAGQAEVSPYRAGFALPGTHQTVILSAAGGVVDSGLSLTTEPSAVIKYQLLFPDSTDVAVGYSVDFAPSGLNQNEALIGNYIDSVQLAGGSESLAPVIATLVGLRDAGSLGAAYDRLSPEPYLGTATGTLFSNIAFSDSLHSCGVPDGPNRFVREGECDWFRLRGGEADQEQTAENMGFARRSVNLSTGAQRAFGDGSWHGGFGWSYEYSTLDVEQNATTSGDQVQVGAIVKKEYGATSLAADLSAGYGGYDTNRYVNLPGPGVTATSSQDVGFVSGHLRLARAYEQGVSWYLKPLIDLGVTQAWFPGFQETGAGAANLNVARRDETYVELTPALEIGGETSLENGLLLRPYAKLGITQFLSGTSPEITASFQGAPVGVAPFTVEGEMDKTYADVHVGLTLLNNKGQILQVGYLGTFSDHLKSNSGAVKLSIPF